MVPYYLQENFHFTDDQNCNLYSADEKLVNFPKYKTILLRKTNLDFLYLKYGTVYHKE